MFAPIGILLALKRKNVFFSLQVFLYTTLIIELIQFFTKKGVFDIDDILLNTVGGLFGFLITKIASAKKTQ